jgi:16S rRNA (uracil1498-N3)-methyltransferase
METEKALPVTRLSATRAGAIVTVKGEEGREYRGRVVEVAGETALVRIFEELDFPSESPLPITLLQALPKKERMELIIQKATELGVSEIIPCVSARSATPGAAGKAEDKSHRWPAVVQRAVEQCRRRVAPSVSPCRAFPEAVESLALCDGLKLLLYEKERVVRLKGLAASMERAKRVVMACGPEGGFTDEEVRFARERGFLPVRLGGRILRCETAALAALSIIQYQWGDL